MFFCYFVLRLFVCIIHRDIASAIKELLDIVNKVFRKYHHPNRMVRRYMKKNKCTHKKSSCCDISGAERLSVFIG